MTNARSSLVGINHVALEVGDVGQALDFYGAIFAFELRGTHEDDDGRTVMAFIDLGDQFIALSEGQRQPPDDGRHFGLVVEDREGVVERAVEAGGSRVDGRANNFRDPWGNRIELVDYRDVQFTKTDAALWKLGVKPDKTPEALEELRQKGLAD